MAKVIGIVGGMGPEATADLFLKIIKETRAERDQDHLRVIIDSNPQIPDRTAAIMGNGTDPVPHLRETAENLIRAGAEVLIMPCNTAHYFYPQIAADLGVPFLHMMQEVAQYIKRTYPQVKQVGLLATTGTLHTRLYHQALEVQGLSAITPTDEMQEQVMEAIYSPQGIKAGHYETPRQLLTAAAEHLVERQAEVIVLGCTEIPLALKPDMVGLPLIDATRVLAQAAVSYAKRK